MPQLCLVKFARKSTLNRAFHKGDTMPTLTTKKPSSAPKASQNAAALEALKEHESELIKQKGKEDL